MNPQNGRRAGKRGTGRNCKTPGAIERAKHYLHDNFNELVSLDELVALTTLSRFHLVRAFALHAGIPPHAYQLKLRIEVPVEDMEKRVAESMQRLLQAERIQLSPDS